MGQFPDGPPGKQRALNVGARLAFGQQGYMLTGTQQVRAMQGVNTWVLEKKP